MKKPAAHHSVSIRQQTSAYVSIRQHTSASGVGKSGAAAHEEAKAPHHSCGVSICTYVQGEQVNRVRGHDRSETCGGKASKQSTSKASKQSTWARQKRARAARAVNGLDKRAVRHLDVICNTVSPVVMLRARTVRGAAVAVAAFFIFCHRSRDAPAEDSLCVRRSFGKALAACMRAELCHVSIRQHT